MLVIVSYVVGSGWCVDVSRIGSLVALVASGLLSSVVFGEVVIEVEAVRVGSPSVLLVWVLLS